MIVSLSNSLLPKVLQNINMSCCLSHAPPKIDRGNQTSQGNEAFVTCHALNLCPAPSNAPLLDFPRQPSHGIAPMVLHPHAHVFIMPPCQHRKKAACMSWRSCILLPLPFMSLTMPQGKGRVCPWHGHGPPFSSTTHPSLKNYLSLFWVLYKRHQPMLKIHNGKIK